MEKTYLRITVLSFAMLLLGEAYGATNTIPTVSPGFTVSLTGLYLQPNANNLIYAIYTHPLPVPAPNWSQVTLKPGYTPAFDLNLQYNFADTANQANVNWLYVSTSNSAAFSASGANSSVAPTYYFGPLAQALIGSSAETKAQFEVSDVNATLGHLINLGLNIQLDPFAGIDTAYLKEEITSTYIGVDSTTHLYSITSYNTSKFTGLGPRVGVNATYFISNHLGISARLGGSLLAGVMKTNTNFDSYGAGNTVLTYTGLADQSQNRVVPEVDSKLEVNYLIPIKGEESNITLAVGYLFTAYINGINQIVPTALVPGAFNGGTLAIETTAQTQSDLDLNGPYASLVWKF